MSTLADNPGAGPKAARLGEILIEQGLLSSEQLAIALSDQQVSGNLLGAILIERGFAAPTTVAAALATQYGGLLKTEYGFATGFGPPPAQPAAASQPAPSEVVPLRVAPQLVDAPPAPAAQPEAPPVQAPAPPAEDPRLAELARERDELGAAMVDAGAAIERLTAENARLVAQLAEDRDRWGAEIERFAAENKLVVGQLAELTAERDAARAAPETGNDGLAARVAELEVLLARVTNRGSTISERLDEVIGDVARLHERLDADETQPAARPPHALEQPGSDRV